MDLLSFPCALIFAPFLEYRVDIMSDLMFKLCLEDAFSYKTEKDWLESKSELLGVARMRGWVPLVRAGFGEITLDSCIADACNYPSNECWRDKAKVAWAVADCNGWLGIISFERCCRSAEKYYTPDMWKRGDIATYTEAKNGGFLDACTERCQQNMKQVVTSSAVDNAITYEVCSRNALQYKKVTEWEEASKEMFDAATSRGWLESCLSHMVDDRPWTIDRCISVAKRFKTKSAWRREHSSSFKFAAANGLIDECLRAQALYHEV